MNDVKRYEIESPCGFAEFEDNDGEWVKHTDYQTLQGDRDDQYDMKVKARNQRDEIAEKAQALQSENDQLKQQVACESFDINKLAGDTINKLKADAVREFANSTVLSGRVMEEAIIYANKLEAGE